MFLRLQQGLKMCTATLSCKLRVIPQETFTRVSTIPKRNTYRKPKDKKNSLQNPSMGIILHSQINGEFYYCLVKRRCGYGLEKVLKVDIADTTCFTEICNDERRILLKMCCLEDGWMDQYEQLWRTIKWIPSVNSHTYKTSIEKFKSNVETIKQMIETTQSIFPYGVWDIPKGLRHEGESEMNCALREVREETMTQDIELTSVPTQQEKYKKWYYKYYIGKVDNSCVVDRVNNRDTEVGYVGWFKIDDALRMIPRDANERYRILNNVHNLLSLSSWRTLKA